MNLGFFFYFKTKLDISTILPPLEEVKTTVRKIIKNRSSHEHVKGVQAN
jgi:hypothetical protein